MLPACRQEVMTIRRRKMLETADSLGAALAVAFYVLAILVFAFRLIDRPACARAAGWVELILALPLAYLLITAAALERPALYWVQVGLMLAWLVLEFVLDYILRAPFREVQWAVIAYVMLFFAGTGGMLGVAARAGRGWMILSVVLFLIMSALAFVQRVVTGM